MSALGQKQTYALQKAMSALLPKADMCSALAHVCFGPKADIKSLPDHIAGAGKHRRRNCEAECFGGLEVDDHLVPGRRLSLTFSRAVHRSWPARIQIP
jgi:hypothetical protein